MHSVATNGLVKSFGQALRVPTLRAWASWGKIAPNGDVSSLSGGKVIPQEQISEVDGMRLFPPIAQHVAKDFEMLVTLGEEGQGTYWKPGINSLFIDPIIFSQFSRLQVRCLFAHEGAHRRISCLDLVDAGGPKERGFHELWNIIEDCRVNNFLQANFPVFREGLAAFRDVLLHGINEAIHKSKSSVGFLPLHIQAEFEYFLAATNEALGEKHHISSELHPKVKACMEKTLGAARRARECTPTLAQSTNDKNKVRVDAAKLIDIVAKEIWPEYKKLLEEDVKLGAVQEMLAEKIEDGIKSQQGNGIDPIELEPERIIPELAGKLSSAEIGELKKAIEDASETQNSELGKSKEKKGSTERPKVKVQLGEMSEGLLGKLKDHLESLPDSQEQAPSTARPTTSADRHPVREQVAKLQGPKEILMRKAANAQKKLGDEISKKAPLYRQLVEESGKSNLGRCSVWQITNKPPTPPTVKSPKVDLLLEEDREKKKERNIAALRQRLIRKLRSILNEKMESSWQSGYRRGPKLAQKRRVPEIARGIPAFATHAYRQKTALTEKDYSFGLLLDLSGSMRGAKIGQAQDAARLFIECLSQLRIRNELWGFNSDLYGIKSFAQPVSNKVISRLEALSSAVSNQIARNTDTGWAVREISHRIRREKASQKYLIVVTDGIPEPSMEHSGPENDLDQNLKKIAKEGRITVIGIGVGPGTEEVRKKFPISLNVPDVEQLPEKMAELLKDIIADKYRQRQRKLNW